MWFLGLMTLFDVASASTAKTKANIDRSRAHRHDGVEVRLGNKNRLIQGVNILEPGHSGGYNGRRSNILRTLQSESNMIWTCSGQAEPTA